MRALRPLNRTFSLLGQRYPLTVGLVVGLTLFGSVLGAVAWRGGFKLLAYVGLAPDLVWFGQVWRLVTWPFFESDPLSLFFGCLVLLLVGRDLCYAWGPPRFLGVYLGFAAATGLLTSLVGRFLWLDVFNRIYLTPWPLADALIIAWALLFPQRTILMMFVLPLSGRNLIYGTLGLTLLYGLLSGMDGVVPHFIAQGLMLVYMRDPLLYEWWLRLRLRFSRGRGRRRPGHLRPVDRHDDEPPRWVH